jgi:hypothetical protein
MAPPGPYRSSSPDFDDRRLLTPGDTVTVWPALNRRHGESYDTEPGAQPWKATYLGTTKDGKLLVQEGSYEPREINAANLGPNYYR